MRPSDLLPVSGVGIGGGASAVLLHTDQWFAALTIFVVVAVASLVVWDVKRAKGIPKWAEEVVRFFDTLAKSKDEWAKRRVGRRKLKLVARQERKALRRSAHRRAKRVRGRKTRA